jgi:hypothetical protein
MRTAEKAEKMEISGAMEADDIIEYGEEAPSDE